MRKATAGLPEDLQTIFQSGWRKLNADQAIHSEPTELKLNRTPIMINYQRHVAAPRAAAKATSALESKSTALGYRL